MRGLWRRAADRLIPPDTFAGLGRVRWRATGPGDPATSSAVTVAATFEIPASLLGIWVSPNGYLWRPWPTITDLLAMALADVKVTAGPFDYFRPKMYGGGTYGG